MTALFTARIEQWRFQSPLQPHFAVVSIPLFLSCCNAMSQRHYQRQIVNIDGTPLQDSLGVLPTASLAAVTLLGVLWPYQCRTRDEALSSVAKGV
jgi:hypothetical protein